MNLFYKFLYMYTNLLIEHSDVVDFLSLNILLQNYSDEIKLNELSEGKFINDLESSTFNLDLKQHIVDDLSQLSSSGTIIDFYQDQKNKLQIAISISHLSNRIVVIFKNLEDEFEWYSNISTSLINLHDDVFVNTNFHDQLTENTTYYLQRKLQEISINFPTYQIYFTGYSLGGAISTLAAYIIAREVKSYNIIVVSFGSPRVGNDKWVDSFKNIDKLTNYRITIDKDILKSLPLLNYKHTGININLEENNYDVFDENNEYPWYQFSLFNCWNITNRNTTSYLKRLSKNKWSIDI